MVEDLGMKGLAHKGVHSKQQEAPKWSYGGANGLEEVVAAKPHGS